MITVLHRYSGLDHRVTKYIILKDRIYFFPYRSVLSDHVSHTLKTSIYNYFVVCLYISQLIRFARTCSRVDDFNERNLFITNKLLKQGYRYYKLSKYFTKFYHRNSDLALKCNCNLKTLLQLGISKPDFYGDVVYKLRRIMVHSNFSAVFTKIIKRFIKRGYDPIILRHTACLVFNPFTIGRYAFLF
jgi:hypothetical protein